MASRRPPAAVALLGTTLLLSLAPRAESESALSIKAREAYADGDFSRAAELLDREARRSPRDPEILARLALARFQAGDREGARLAAAASSALDPEPSRAWAQRIAAGLAAPSPEEALLPLIELARLEAGDCTALVLAARIERDLGRRWPAAALLEEALPRCPTRAALLVDLAMARLEQGCPSAAFDLLNRARGLRNEPEVAERAEALAARARRLLDERFRIADQGLFNVARQLGAGGESDQPSTGSNRSQERLHAAITLPRRVAESEADDPEVEVRMAEGYRVAHVAGFDGSLGPARAHATRALELRGPWSRALVLLGTLELAEDPTRPEEAENAFLAALAAQPDPDPLAWAGLFFAHVARQRYRAAVVAADRYLELSPDDAEIGSLRDEVRARVGPLSQPD